MPLYCILVVTFDFCQTDSFPKPRINLKIGTTKFYSYSGPKFVLPKFMESELFKAKKVCL